MPTRPPSVLPDIQELFDSGILSRLTDAQLLERFASRQDGAAFGALVERHGALVLRVGCDLLGDGFAAEDVFQATFFVLARKAGSLWVEDDLTGWLYAVARRVSLKARTEQARRKRHERRAARNHATEDRSVSGNPELVVVLQEEIGRLPESYRTPILLCYFEGMSYEAAACRLGVSESTVRGRLARARERLRVRLTRRAVVLPAGLFGAGLPSDAVAAAVSARVAATVRGAAEFAAGRVTSRGGPRAAALAKGVLKTMLLTKLKIGVAFLLAASCVALVPVLRHDGLAWGSDAPAARSNPAGAEPSGPEPPREAPPAGSAARGRAQGIGPNAELPLVTREGEQAQPLGDAAAKPDAAEPPLIRRARPPKPWQTVVRVKVFGDRAVGFGSGTVIDSTPGATLALTAAHTYRIDDGPLPPPRRFTRKITVDLFDGMLRDGESASVRYTSDSFPAELVDFDAETDVALIRFRPDRILPASPVVPASWRPAVGMKMITAGCSEGRDATFWSTRITLPVRRNTIVGKPRYAGIGCEYAPKQGRTGGGLFTEDGYLAGVCNYSDPVGRGGLYAAPESVNALLKRHLDLKHAAAPKQEGTVLFVHRDRLLGIVSVSYDAGTHAVGVALPPAGAAGLQWTAWEPTPSGPAILETADVAGTRRVFVDTGQLQAGVTTVFLAADAEEIDDVLSKRRQHREDATAR